MTCEPGLEVVGEAGDVDSAVALAASLQPSVVVMDLHMGEGDGIDATRRILATTPGQRVVIHSMQDDPRSRELAAAAGALAFVGKQEGPDRLLQVVRRLASDSSFNQPDPRRSPVTKGPASE